MRAAAREGGREQEEMATAMEGSMGSFQRSATAPIEPPPLSLPATVPPSAVPIELPLCSALGALPPQAAPHRAPCRNADFALAISLHPSPRDPRQFLGQHNSWHYPSPRRSAPPNQSITKIAGNDKPSSNGSNSVMPKLNPVPSSNGNNPVMPKLNPIPLPKQTQIMHCSDMPVSHNPAYPVVNGRIGGYGFSPTPRPYGFLPQGGPVHSHGQVRNSTYDYNRQAFGYVLNIPYRGPVMDAFAHGAANQPIMYPS